MQEPQAAVLTTRDLYLASTLIVMGFPMQNIVYQYEGTRSQPVGYFQFDRTKDLEAADKAYWAGKTSVEPRAFVMAMRGLKSQTASAYKSPV